MGALALNVSAQTIYYVAADGNDSNDGRSASHPFLRLASINALQLQPGDQVLLRRGDTFRGELLIRQSGSAAQPIVIDAYGTGAKPVLSGSEPLTNWTNLRNNRWQATCSGCTDRVTGLYRNNSALPLGRYPNLSDANKGYLTVQSHTGKTQFTSQQPLSTNWTGGEAVYRPVPWILNRANITGQTGNTLNLAGSGNYDISDNWGYFIQNHPATLDQAGEWYYDPASKTILLYDNQTNPNDQAHTVTVSAEAVRISGASFVSIRNLHITQALATGLLVENGSNLVLANNEITQSGEDGIAIRGDGSQVVLENNLIENSNNNGVGIAAYQNVTVRGNTIRRIGLTAGRGKSGDGTYVGFQSASTANTLIEDNVFDNIGYNALNFSTSTTIQRNRISNFCLAKSDGSGIYIWNGNQQPMNDIRILSNVVYNGIGAPEGAPAGTYSGANGIYLDDCTTNMEVSGNSVSNCRGAGIYLHGSSNIRLTGNTAYNNGEGQLAILSANGCQPRTNVIQDNILVSRLADQFTVKYESNQDDLSSYGQFDNNVYARPFEDTRKILAVYNRTTGAALSLAEWQNRYGKDPTSVNSPITYPSGNPDDYINYLVNPTANPAQFSLSGRYRDARNNAHSGQVTVPAFSSVVLLKEIAQPSVALRDPENPADAAMGLDYQYYEGTWDNLPAFDALTPARTGTIASADLAIRSRDTNFALRYKGYIDVPADGVYTFYTASDDGSKLLIGSAEVVNNDGLHPVVEKSGVVGLKAGKHAFTVLYLQRGGGQALTLSYSGPGLNKQVVPTTAFFRISAGDPAGGTGTGLRAEYYNNQSLTAPIVLSRIDATVDFDWGTNSPAPGISADNFSVRWTGQVQAPVSGNYTFATRSDDGVRLWVNGTLLINNWTGHAPTTNTGPSMALLAGQRYDIRMEYFEGPVGAVAKLLWDYPGQGRQAIPQRQLHPAGSGGRVAAVASGAFGSDAAVVVYPVPTRDEVRVRYLADAAGDVTLQLISTAARPVLRETYSVVRGENLLRVPVQDLPRGMYLLTLLQGQQRTTRKIVLTD
ncbi:PA14 domain-containing protein [Spirosoma arcticum]